MEGCPGVTQYQISFQTRSILETENVTIAECTAGRCRHIFEPSPDPLNCCIPSNYDNVSVAAENVAGVGAARRCTAQPISELPGRLAQDPVHHTTAFLQWNLCR